MRYLRFKTREPGYTVSRNGSSNDHHRAISRYYQSPHRKYNRESWIHTTRAPTSHARLPSQALEITLPPHRPPSHRKNEPDVHTHATDALFKLINGTAPPRTSMPHPPANTHQFSKSQTRSTFPETIRSRFRARRPLASLLKGVSAHTNEESEPLGQEQKKSKFRTWTLEKRSQRADRLTD